MPPAKTQTKQPTIKSTPKQQQPIYRVTFRGQYINGNTEAGKSGFVNYETTVRMEEDAANYNAQSIFAAQIAPIIMPRRFPDYRGLYTFEVIQVEREDGEPITNIFLLNFAELEALIIREKLPIHVALYKDQASLRDAILEYAKDKVSFLKGQQGQFGRLTERDQYLASSLALNLDDEQLHDTPVLHTPSLDEVIKTKEVNDKRAKEKAKQINKNLPRYTDNDTDAQKEYDGGERLVTDKLDNDEFPDGRHTIDGKPVLDF